MDHYLKLEHWGRMKYVKNSLKRQLLNSARKKKSYEACSAALLHS